MKRSVRMLVFGILMLTVSVLSLSMTSSAQVGVGISVRIGPPALPVYAQPICPGPGYLWTPGYWAWNDDDGYYWVPGTWVIAPVGMLWTPGYWGWGGGFYIWHPGYWGRHVGFYGGINYGFGYGGFGYGGGEWRGDRFFYNRSVTNVNVINVTNVYNRTVIVNNRRRVSYNGGSGGIDVRPTRREQEFGREPHREALAAQSEHEHAAGRNRELFASENHGRPRIAATDRPGEFRGGHIERARAAGEPYHAPKISPREARGQSPDNHGGNRGFDAPRNSGNVNNGRNSEARGQSRDNRGGNRGLDAPRNGGNFNDRAMSRPEKREAGNRGQMSRDNPRDNANHGVARPDRPERGHQDRAAQNRMEKPNRAPAKAEPKRNERERR